MLIITCSHFMCHSCFKTSTFTSLKHIKLLLAHGVKLIQCFHLARWWIASTSPSMPHHTPFHSIEGTHYFMLLTCSCLFDEMLIGMSRGLANKSYWTPPINLMKNLHLVQTLVASYHLSSVKNRGSLDLHTTPKSIPSSCEEWKIH